MAIREARKAHIAFPAGEYQKVLEALQRWGFLEIYSKKEIFPLDGDDGRLSQLILKLKFIVEFFEEFQEATSTWEKLKQGLPEVEPKRLEEIKEQTDIRADYEKLRGARKKIRKLEDRRQEALVRIEELREIKNIKLSASQLATFKTKTIIALAGQEEIEKLEDLDQVYVHRITPTSPAVTAVVFFKEDAGRVSAALEKLKLHVYELDRDSSPPEEIKALKKLLKTTGREIESVRSSAKKICREKLFDYRVLLDYYENFRTRQREGAKAISTGYARIISAWCPADMSGELRSRLQKVNIPFHLEFEKTAPEDDPPVMLENRGFSESFEVVTGLYGTPAYEGVDPTPHLSWFFAFFFGLCLGDAGYGLILVGLSLWSLKYLKISPGARKFIKLILSSGIAAVIAGFLSGGFFGDALKGTAVIESLRIVDLMESPEYFLYFSIGLGFVQVIYGQFIAAFLKIKRGMVKESIYEDFTKIAFVLGASLFIVNSLALDSELLGRVAFYLGGAGVAGILFLSGHEAKHFLLRPLKGLGNLYGMTDYFKDMVSYSRIFALGMATAILGMAINEISKQLPGMLGVLAYVAIPLVLIGGHLVINLLMSCLSAYVHTSRLQYVEFFTKFFEGGGRRFRPFRVVEKRVNFARE